MDERARRVLEAARALPAGALANAADQVGGPAASLLREVDRALNAPDPEQAIVRAFEGIGAEPGPFIDAAVRALEAGAATVPALGSLRAEIDRLARARGQLAEAVAHMPQPAGEEEQALAALLSEGLDFLDDDGPFATLKSAIASIDDLGGGIRLLAGTRGRAATDARSQSGEMAGKLADLRRRRDAIRSSAAQLQHVAARVAAAHERAAARGAKIASAELAAVEAAIRDDEPGAEVRWRAAFDAAVEAEALPLAKAVADRVQMGAVAGGELEPIADSAAQVAALAARAGDTDVELGAVGDEALARVQMEGGQSRARELAQRAFALAGDDPSRTARAHLLGGQVFEKLGDEQEARRAFQRVERIAEQTDGLDSERGWAAFHLGGLEGARGEDSRCREHLELAQKIGRGTGDATLFGFAIAARIDLADDRAAAEGVLAEAEDAPDWLREQLDDCFHDRWDV